MKYYCDVDGKYLGGWDDEVPGPGGSTEVPTAPGNSKQVWNGTTWSEYFVPQPQELTASIAVAYGTGDLDIPWQLFSFLDAIRFGSYNSALRKLVWARLRADAPVWFTEAVRTKMLAWAI